MANLFEGSTSAKSMFLNSMRESDELSLFSADMLSNEGAKLEVGLVNTTCNHYSNKKKLDTLNYK